MTEFAPVKYASKAIAAAMVRLSDSAALIVDMRDNHGGEPETVALLCSYLFDKRTHLNDIYWRAGDRTEQFWTDEKITGPKFGQDKSSLVERTPAIFSA
jgi:C-terminal processing protease CtpA/Prc